MKRNGFLLKMTLNVVIASLAIFPFSDSESSPVVLKADLKLQAGEVIDASTMSRDGAVFNVILFFLAYNCIRKIN